MSIIETMRDAIIVSRDLCGNEREAALEAAYESDGRRPTASEYLLAMRLANNRWREFQRAAGVAERHCDGLGGLHSPAVTAALEGDDT